MACRNVLKQIICLWEHKEDVNRGVTIMEGLFSYKCEQNIMQKVCYCYNLNTVIMGKLKSIGFETLFQ